MNHRRDFLRENKLSLRELQKCTSQKLTHQKQEFENRQYKHLQKYHKSQEQCMARRSDSQTKNVEQTCKRPSRLIERGGVVVDRGGGVAATTKEKQNYLACRRAYSQQRHSIENLKTTSSTCCCHHQQEKSQHSERQPPEIVRRCASSVSVLSKAESCDKEIQTEDIHDEDFLYEALKKCSSSDVHILQKQKSIEQLHSNKIQQHEPDLNSVHSRERVPCISQNQYEDKTFQHDQLLQHTGRSQNSCNINGYKHTLQDELVNGANEDLDQHFQNFKISADKTKDAELQLSARSRQTMCSTSTRRSIHKLGSREDVRLPRYLEKEKREREEDRLRELNRDTNCPLDHFVLSEEERLKALNKARQKMASLISELNHMPITVETLRIRNRKNEIEKELTQIEFDIRLYSKPKVYIPITSSQY